MDFLPLIIQLVSGAGGGNLAAKLMKNLDLGMLGNSLAGILGGGLGGQLLGMAGLAAESGAMDPASILTSLAGGGAGGGVLMAIVGMIKKAMAK